MDDPLLFVAAGEPSGDNAASRLISELRLFEPDLKLFGLGGGRLQKQGQDQLADSGHLAVLGFWEVAKRFRFFRQLLKKCEKEIERRRPNCILLVDYPGFNLRLARRVKRLGIPIVYYISPQIWAWGGNRVKEIAQLVDLMLLILPFEQRFYSNTSVKYEFVGHYLLEDIADEQVASEIPTDGHLCLMPGSRKQEIERMLPVMLQAAARFNSEFGVKAVVAAVSGVFDYDRVVEPFRQHDVTVEYDNSRSLIYESSLVLTASGTATLECAVIGRPMVVVYKTGWITYQIAKRLVQLDSIALVNLVLAEGVVPELIQADASPENMFEKLRELWQDESLYRRIKRKLDGVADNLGGKGASRRAAEEVARFL
ncbi:MAG: lipid-A-disaccharide synthase [Candidatus Zixiibacteriota bacterium]